MLDARPLRPIKDEKLEDLLVWYPEERPLPPDGTFEIGLVLAGGQSAGCYLAGVLDFLFQALDCWSEARRRDPEGTPNHTVKIKIIVGASAGGLNAALAAVAAAYEFAPASHIRFEDGDKNLGSPFYRAWVRDIDITNLLTTDDLKPGAAGFSVLNTDYLDKKVQEYVSFKTGTRRSREWFDDPLPIKIAVSNLEGVPYQVRFTTEGGEQLANENSLSMRLHRDHLSFLRPLSDAAPKSDVRATPDCDLLPFNNTSSERSLWRLQQAILATIAFPIALRQRDIDRPSTDYDYRYVFPSKYHYVYSPGYPGATACERQFVTIDGGVLDNEPFELAHAALAGSLGQNPPEGEKAKRGVVMVAPFVSPKPVQPAPGTLSLLGFLGDFFAALVDQNRFKPIDLSLAEDDNIYSRYLIAPVRHDGKETVRGDAALASHALHAFMGYFSEHYRHHDFMLGRQNCYKFLRDWFALPSSRDGVTQDPGEPPVNPLFAHWPQRAKDNPAFNSSATITGIYRQVIPLLGSAAIDPGAARWPSGQFGGFAPLKPAVRARLNALYPRLRDQLVEGLIESRIGRWFARRAADIYFCLSARARLLKVIEKLINDAQCEIDKSI